MHRPSALNLCALCLFTTAWTAATTSAQEERKPWPEVATFSILGYDQETGEIGGAVQSRVFSVGNGVLWAEADVGAIATQARVDVSYGPQSLALLRIGKSPAEVIAQVLAADLDPRPRRWSKNGRQFAVIDAQGHAAAHTGSKATPWAGHVTGEHFSAQGNTLAGKAVVEAMARAFQATGGRLALRLLAALEAGQTAGGDKRGMQSAAMLIVKKDGGVWLHNDVVLRLQVDDHEQPIAELRRLMEKGTGSRRSRRGRSRRNFGQRSQPQDQPATLVQAANWWEKLPRPGYAMLQHVGSYQDWFQVYQLEHGTYAIYEPYQFQEAISYLLVGTDQAVLVDAGNGIGNIAKVTAELTDLPVTVLLTHEHPDHFGGAHQFDKIGIRPLPSADAILRRGVPNARARTSITGAQVWKPLPAGVDPETFAIPPVRANMFLADGQIIDLGGRRIEVIFTPGHSPASVCYLDLDRGLLLTGDHYYPGPLYTHSAGVNIDAFLDSNQKLVERIDDYHHLLPGHNEPWVECAVLKRINPAFATIFAGGGEFTQQGDLRRYRFDGFEVLIGSAQVKARSSK